MGQGVGEDVRNDGVCDANGFMLGAWPGWIAVIQVAWLGTGSAILGASPVMSPATTHQV
jgi:hypothetical protein